MKLLRYGPKGQEKPGLLDAQGKIRDLSKVVDDIDGAALTDEGLAKLRALDPASLPLVEGNPRIGPVRRQDRQVHLHRPELRGSRGRIESAGAAEPVIFNKWTSAISGPNDDVEIPRGSKKTDWEVELGVVIGKRGEIYRRGQRARLRRRLLRHQRRVRTRMADRTRRHVGQGQGLRHVRPDRPVGRHAR